MGLKTVAGKEHRVYTTGGAPMGPGLAMGRLSALVQPNSHPSWDSAHLPALAELGASVIRLDNGKWFPLDQIRDVMSVGRFLKKSDVDGGFLPPYVAARR